VSRRRDAPAGTRAISSSASVSALPTVEPRYSCDAIPGASRWHDGARLRRRADGYSGAAPHRTQPSPHKLLQQVYTSHSVTVTSPARQEWGRWSAARNSARVTWPVAGRRRRTSVSGAQARGPCAYTTGASGRTKRGVAGCRYKRTRACALDIPVAASCLATTTTLVPGAPAGVPA